MGGRLEQSQQLRPLQKLILTPQMQQSLHILQLPIQEIGSLIAEEIERNPLLEWVDSEEKELPFRSEGGKEEEDLHLFIENSLVYENSLYAHLMSQAKQEFSKPKELLQAEVVIGHLDERGFLSTTLEEISELYDFSMRDLEKVLLKIQTFEPLGVGARSLQESFLIQLREKKCEYTLGYEIIKSHFEDLLRNHIPVIAKALRRSPEKINEELLSTLSHLSLRPGCHFDPKMDRRQWIIPDVFLYVDEGTIHIEVNERDLPLIRLNRNYFQLLENTALSADEKSFFEEKISSFKHLMKNIQERHSTLRRIAALLSEKQRDFFLSLKATISPLTMKELASELELHESTVVRAVANKYVQCELGVFSLRSFFTNAYHTDDGEDLSSKAVKQLLFDLVRDEKKNAPYSDEDLSSLLKEKGVCCARRTVAKYRKELGLGTASQRKRHL